MIRCKLRLQLFLGALALPALLAAPALAADDPVVATVDGDQIHQSEVVAAYHASPLQQAPLEQVFPQVLDSVITIHLLATEARKNKLDQNPDVKTEITAAEQSILAQAYLERRTASMVSEKDVQSSYQAIVKGYQGKSEAHIFHIVADSEADAKAVIADLDKGTKFADEAKAKSTDSDGKDNGGDIGFFGDQEMSAVPGMADQVAKLQPGQHSPAPLQTQFGWQVLMVSERKAVAAPTIDEARPQITQQLEQDAARKAITDLRSGVQIQAIGADGKPLPSPQAPAAH